MAKFTKADLEMDNATLAKTISQQEEEIERLKGIIERMAKAEEEHVDEIEALNQSIRRTEAFAARIEEDLNGAYITARRAVSSIVEIFGKPGPVVHKAFMEDVPF